MLTEQPQGDALGEPLCRARRAGCADTMFRRNFGTVAHALAAPLRTCFFPFLMVGHAWESRLTGEAPAASKPLCVSAPGRPALAGPHARAAVPRIYAAMSTVAGSESFLRSSGATYVEAMYEAWRKVTPRAAPDHTNAAAARTS